MSQWLQSAKATVSAGASVITFTDNKDFASVRAGDVVMINGQIWQCTSGTRPDSAGQSTVTLAAPWPYTGASNVNAFVFRTTHDLLQLTSDARKLTNITKALLAAQEDILKGTTPTISVQIGLDPATGNEEVIEVTPWQYVINVVNASLGNISAIGAMSQVQFEAIRQQNKETYAASAWVSFGNHESGRQVNECKPGLYTSLTTPNTLLIGKAGGVGGSKTDHGVLCIAGVIFNLPLAYPVRLAPAPDGKTTYNKSTGVITNHATVAAAFNAQAADPVNIEVVINRVDMWGFEAFPQEVTPANPEIYPQGVFSDLFSSMNGIQTSDSARPVSYFGFLGKKAKKVDFFALSDAQKKKVLSDPKNNLYYSDDGRLIQWVLRGKEFAGAGNGDWQNVDSTVGDAMVFSGSARAKAQGTLDSVAAYTNGFVTDYVSKFTGAMFIEDTGSFGIRGTNKSIAVNGECYFLVGGTINRLNQGAYHPSFNASGAAANDSGNPWYGYSVEAITSTLSCFTAKYFGSISSSNSGRPDGRYYDAIYASGQGGVCRDMRYSANGVDAIDFAEADQRVKNGTYRGFEGIPYFGKNQFSENGPTRFYFVNSFRMYFYSYQLTSSIDKYVGMPVWAVSKDGNTIITGKFTGEIHSTGYAVIENISLVKGIFPVGGSSLAVAAWDCYSAIYTPVSLGGLFLQTDVIGPPANILAIPALANGWQGSWCDVIPDNSWKGFPRVRKGISNNNALKTDNTGASWEVINQQPPSSSNWGLDMVLSANSIALVQYQAFAKQTENAVNAAVYGGVIGIGSVATVRVNDIKEGSLLQESLIGKVNTDTTAWITSVNLISVGLSAKDHLVPVAGYYSKHPASMFEDLAPTNNSPTVKALNYNVNINQQAFIQYAYTELKHNGSSWGDDGKVTIVDNQATKTDLNGNTVLVGTAKLKEPLGWIKNKV